MLRISNNIAAGIALGGLRTANASFERTAERLATGQRITRPSDEPGTFVGIEILKSQLNGIGAAIVNTQTARNTLDIAQDGITEIYTRLIKLRAVALRAMGGEIATSDPTIFQDEANQLIADIDRIARTTKLGGNRVLDGSGEFYTEKTGNAFERLDIKRLKFGPYATRDFTVDLTRAAERATLVTNLDLGGMGSVMTGATASVLSIEGPRGVSQVPMTDGTTAEELVAQINGSAELTGMYASTQVVNGAESAVTALTLADQELTGGLTFTMDVQVGTSATTVTVTTTDVDGDGNGEITGADIERALNTANLGYFSVIEGTDGAGDKNLIFRHAGAETFTINNFTNGSGALTAGAAALSINGVEPADARIVSNGLTFDATTRTASFDVEVYGTNAAWRRTISLTGTTANYNNGADLQAEMEEIATVTHLGVDRNGQDIFLFTAAAGVEGFRFTESTNGGTDANEIGLLSHSGGGSGLASTGMGVLALYSEGFGADQSVSIRNASDGQFAFNALDENDSAVAGMAQNGLPMRANGIDAIAWINGAQVRALNGFHFAYSSAYADIDIDLSQRFGRGSFTNTITRALNLDFTTAGTYSLAGYRPITNMYDGDVFKISQPNNALEDPFSNELLNAGVIDRVEFSVFKNRPDSNVRSGLGVQLTGELDGREYISIQNFQSAHLGGLPTAEGVVGTFSNTLVMGAGTISQIAREGAFNLEGPPAQISHAIAIIDRAIKETVRTQSFLGTYQVVTLDSNRDFLSSLQSSVAQTAQDLSTVDIAREVTEMTGAQLRVQAAAGILAQANSLPQTLLTLLR